MQRALECALDPEVLPLALGLPATEFFPSQELAEAAAAVLRDDASTLQYGRPQSRLKQHVVDLMHRRGVKCTEDEIFLTSGAQQALSLLAQLLVRDHGDPVLVGSAVYPGFRQAVEPMQARLIPVRMDATHGIDLEEGERLIREWPEPSFLYTMAVAYNPLGLTLNSEARRNLVGFAHRHRVAIVEDDVYGFLQYDGDPAPPLASLDREWVIYVGSFSKIIAPALRVGWIVCPRNLISSLSVLKEGSDINTGTVAQRVVCRYLDSTPLSRRIEDLQTRYGARRNAMQAALARRLAHRAQWQTPSAGFFFWVESDMLGDTQTLLPSAVRKGVTFVPGSAFSAPGSGLHRNAMRLSFSHCNPEAIDEGIGRIGAALRECSLTAHGRTRFKRHAPANAPAPPL